MWEGRYRLCLFRRFVSVYANARFSAGRICVLHACCYAIASRLSEMSRRSYCLP
jgi:hypothetical protein